MQLVELIPVVDPTADPCDDLDACEAILLKEGYPEEQVDEWLRVVLMLSPGGLRLMLQTQRQN